MLEKRFMIILGWVATFTAVCMYVSYIQQIDLNLSGMKGAQFNHLQQQSTVHYGWLMVY